MIEVDIFNFNWGDEKSIEFNVEYEVKTQNH